MPASDSQPLKWSASLKVAPSSRTPQLSGDKVLLPPSALEELLQAAPVVVSDPNGSRALTSTFDPFNPHTYAAERAARAQAEDRQHQLPHPLTFRLVNPDNGNAIYAGIREFSANDHEVALSPALREALDIRYEKAEHKGVDTPMEDGIPEAEEDVLPRIAVHFQQLPKGTFVKLRPLEAGYDVDDWKALLEQHLRNNYTTLTRGTILVVPGGRDKTGKREEFQFLVDSFKPEGDAICVVDTDLEVDIEALSEEQARETLKKIFEKRQRQESSEGGQLTLFRPEHGQVVDGEYVDYEVPSWDRSQGVEIELGVDDDTADIDVLVSPYSPRQRVRPREDEYVFAEMASRYPKRIRIQPKNVELEDAEALWVSVHAFAPAEAEATARPYTIRVGPFDPTSVETDTDSKTNEAPPRPDDVQCKNCLQWVPKARLILHENFCLRNNILCPQGCGHVFQKSSDEWKTHWHCPHDTFYGNTALSHSKHNYQYHTEQTCLACDRKFPSLPMLAAHRTSVCPGKLILCQFCHLEVPQEGDPDTVNAEAIISGLTPHELADGARTTECHRCGKIVRLRDMRIHLANHELEKKNRPPPRVCRNVFCGRTLDGVSKTGDTRSGTRRGNGPGNDIGLCSVCFGPLYVAMYDPDGKALKRRVERKYLMQLLTGCGKAWCRNEYCKTGRKNLGMSDGETIATKDVIPMVKPFVDGVLDKDYKTPLHLCTDEGNQKRRVLAEHMPAERDLKGRSYGFEWCVAAMEAESGDLGRAREWLANWAPAMED
jgi:Ubiquitin fusion degradation protein UFD1/Amino-terminal Zinc-binding domain of ubiquitin ligase E3A